MEQILCNKKAWVSWHFKKGLGPKKLVRNICLSCVGRRVIGVLVVSTTRLIFIGSAIYMPARPVVTRPR